MRLPIVGVMGSRDDEFPRHTQELGRWLGSQPVHLLTGGGPGIMSSVSRAFSGVSDRKGLVIGVLPCRPNDALCHPRDGYPNPWVEIAILTHLPDVGQEAEVDESNSRNHINVLSSDVIVALPGGHGTRNEVALAVRYKRPVIAYVIEGTDVSEIPGQVPIAYSLGEVKEFVQSHLRLAKT